MERDDADAGEAAGDDGGSGDDDDDLEAFFEAEENAKIGEDDNERDNLADNLADAEFDIDSDDLFFDGAVEYLVLKF